MVPLRALPVLVALCLVALCLVALCLVALCAAIPARGGQPRPAHGTFVTPNYALTFTAPPAASYCPLAWDWTGSDHGTSLFLAPPNVCGGAGYPSSSRAFTPETTPRIDVYYGNWPYDADDPPPARHCKRLGEVRFLGRPAPLCRARAGRMIGVNVEGRYQGSSPAEASVTLLTTRPRWSRDLAVFKRWVRSVRPCTATWTYPDGKTELFGQGAACPAHGDFY